MYDTLQDEKTWEAFTSLDTKGKIASLSNARNSELVAIDTGLRYCLATSASENTWSSVIHWAELLEAVRKEFKNRRLQYNTGSFVFNSPRQA